MPPKPGPFTTPHTRLSADRRGQMGPLAVAILLGIVVLGTTAVVAVGSTALSDTRQASELQRVELAMTQLDSLQAAVALGDDDVQSLSLGGATGGQYAVEPDAGWIRVEHHDYGDADETVHNETIFNGTLGAVVYRNGDTVIASQGGGVWRRDGDASSMVSPPEFHYQEETLVLPVVRLEGDDSVGGPTRATISTAQPAVRVFPDRDGDAPDGIGAPYDDEGEPAYRNPIQGGSVRITVHSEFYEAWGRYLDERTEGMVSVDHARQTATVELTAPRTLGTFDMPEDGKAIDIRGIPDGHAVDAFTIDLTEADSDSANFHNLQWSLYVDDGSREFELHLRFTNPVKDKDAPCQEKTVAATIYFSDTNGNPYHGWTNESAFRTQCVGDDSWRLVANLTGATTLELTPLSSKDLNGEIKLNRQAKLEETVTFDEHEDDVDWEPATFQEGDEVPIGDLVDHYLGLLGPDYDLVVDDKSSDTVEESDSTGYLLYDGEGRVTFMHISDNRVRVVLEAGGP